MMVGMKECEECRMGVSVCVFGGGGGVRGGGVREVRWGRCDEAGMGNGVAEGGIGVMLKRWVEIR